MDHAVRILQAGGVIVYPTETLYGMGCDGRNLQAVARVARIKGRPESKPLPVIIGSLEMLELVSDPIPPLVRALARAFWPGPLSVLTPARPELAPGVRDGAGFVSVRLSPHPVARELSRRGGMPLVATSANLSGNDPTADPARLDPAMLAAVDLAITDPPWPGGGAPSTLVRPVSGHTIQALRVGAIRVEELEAKGFHVVVADAPRF
ncbi:MAG: L-threonylcarbamoyladenylate synthase [Desulfovibrionaceae bacterium]